MVTVRSIPVLLIAVALSAAATRVGAQARKGTARMGVLRDAVTGEAVPFATIGCGDCPMGGAISNADGLFEVTLADEQTRLQVRHLLYLSLDSIVARAGDTLHFALLPADHILPAALVSATDVYARDLVRRARAGLLGASDDWFTAPALLRQVHYYDAQPQRYVEAEVELKTNNQMVRPWRIDAATVLRRDSVDGIWVSNFGSVFQNWPLYNPEHPATPWLTPLTPGADSLYAYELAGILVDGRDSVAIVRTYGSREASGTPVNFEMYISVESAELLQLDFLNATDFFSIQDIDGDYDVDTAKLTVSYRFAPSPSGPRFTSQVHCAVDMQVRDIYDEVHYNRVSGSLYVGVLRRHDGRQKGFKPMRIHDLDAYAKTRDGRDVENGLLTIRRSALEQRAFEGLATGQP